MPRARSLSERFWEKVTKGDGCWEWQGATSRPTGYGNAESAENLPGYGSIGSGGRGKNLSAHHVSWLLHFGDIPPEMHVLHHCDNTLCVRPDHLFLGNHQRNMEDRQNRGRTARELRNGKTKLSDEQVAEIRKLRAQGATNAVLGRQFGVDESWVSRLVNKVFR